MAKAKRADLAKALIVTAEVMGHELSAIGAETMADDLAAYPADGVAGALRRCRRELTGKLTLAAILQRIDDGRPGVEQAWAIASQARDEAATLVWTDEMSEAWGAASKLRDDVAARMAFKEAYTGLLTLARDDGRPTRWTVSLGHDQSRRSGPILEAVEAKRLTADRAREYVHPGLPDFDTADARLLRLEGNASSALPKGSAAQLDAVNEMLAGIGGPDLRREKGNGVRRVSK